MKIVPATLLQALAIASMSALVGCAASDEQTRESETTESTSEALKIFNGGLTDPPPMVIDPVPPHPSSILTNREGQKRVTSVWKYVTGGSTHPLDLYPTALDSKQVLAFRANLTTLRDLMAANATDPAHSCDTFQWGSRYIDNYNDSDDPAISVAVEYYSCSGITLSQVNQIKAISGAIDAAWPGAKAFWHITCFTETLDASGNYYTGFGEADPEPARLNTSLTTNGSTASATYLNTSVGTSAYRWTSSWTSGSAPAGLPCATVSVSQGTTIYATLQASGSFRKCM